MKKFLLLLLALCSFIFYYFWLPASTPYVSTSLPMQDKMLLLPLDSRPPCTTLAQDLGRLASIDVIVPPNELLDNYHNPGRPHKINGVAQPEHSKLSRRRHLRRFTDPRRAARLAFAAGHRCR